jgi:transcriptional regulator with XRE-family HTH domain
MSDKSAAGPLAILLRSARESRGWSLRESADMLGTTKGHLHDLEAGRASNPTLGLIASFVVVYGIRPEAIVACAISKGGTGG